MVGAVSTSWWIRSRCLLLAAVSVSVATASVLACSSAELKTSTVDPSAGLADGGDEGSVDASRLDGGGGTPTIDGKKLPVSHDVTIQVQPSDLGAALLAAIRGAKKSVHMTMYLLTNDDVIKALVDLHQAGKDVKVILNKTFPPNGGDNGPAFDALKAKGVAVQWAPSAYTFTHAKTIVIDAEQVVIMTMNLTYSSAKTNREYIATDTDPKDVADVETLFQADFDNKAVKIESKLVVSPTNANSIEPRLHLKALIESATTSLDVETQTLSDGTVVDAIIAAHQAKVDVHVVVASAADATESSAQSAAVAKLKQNGVPLRSLATPDVHAKVIVVDENLTFVGSQNMTATALTQNREVGVITDVKSEATKVRQVITGDFDKGAPL